MEMRPCLIDGAAAGEPSIVLEHEAARGDRPGVDADVALAGVAWAACWRAPRGDGRGGEEGEASGHFDDVCGRCGRWADRVF